MTLTSNLDVNVIRDDFTPEEAENPYFNPNSAVRRRTFWTLLYNTVTDNKASIIITDKRTWEQYASDCLSRISEDKQTLFFYVALGLVLLAAVAIKINNPVDNSNDSGLTP